MTRLIEGLMQDWHHLDRRIDAVTDEIEALVAAGEACQRLMSVPGMEPIIASAMMAAIGNGAALSRGRDFGAWVGLVPKQTSPGDRTILGRRGSDEVDAPQRPWCAKVEVLNCTT